MCTPLYSRYGQKGWQWKITALEMQQEERMAQAVFLAIASSLCKMKENADSLIQLYSYRVQAAGRHGSSCFTRTEWISILKLGAHWMLPCSLSTFPGHMDYSIPEAEVVLAVAGSVSLNMMTIKMNEQIISR